jgi:GMP synthase (glutamine-hydrolysing)
MKPLLCIRHQATAPLGIIEEVLAEQQVGWTYLDAYESDAIPGIDDVSGLIVLGGEMNADDLDTYPFLKNVRHLIEQALDAATPVLGVCLGAQLLTRALGAEVRPAEQREIGFHDVTATTEAQGDPVVGPFTPHAKVFQFHEDECELAPGATLLLEGTGTKIQGFKIDNAYGIQFHFEVTPEIVSAWCDEVPDLKDGWGMSKQEVLAEAKLYLADQQRAGRATAKAFLDLVTTHQR